MKIYTYYSFATNNKGYCLPDLTTWLKLLGLYTAPCPDVVDEQEKVLSQGKNSIFFKKIRKKKSQ